MKGTVIGKFLYVLLPNGGRYVILCYEKDLVTRRRESSLNYSGEFLDSGRRRCTAENELPISQAKGQSIWKKRIRDI